MRPSGSAATVGITMTTLTAPRCYETAHRMVSGSVASNDAFWLNKQPASIRARGGHRSVGLT